MCSIIILVRGNINCETNDSHFPLVLFYFYFRHGTMAEASHYNLSDTKAGMW